MDRDALVPESEKRAAKIGVNRNFGFTVHVVELARLKFCFRYGESLGGPVGGRWERCYYELTEKCADFHPSKNHTDKVSDGDPDDDIDTARRLRRGRNRDDRAFDRHGRGHYDANFGGIATSRHRGLDTSAGRRTGSLSAGSGDSVLECVGSECRTLLLQKFGSKWPARATISVPNCQPSTAHLSFSSTLTNRRCLPVSRRRASTGVTSRPVTVSLAISVRRSCC